MISQEEWSLLGPKTTYDVYATMSEENKQVYLEIARLRQIVNDYAQSKIAGAAGERKVELLLEEVEQSLKEIKADATKMRDELTEMQQRMNVDEATRPAQKEW